MQGSRADRAAELNMGEPDKLLLECGFRGTRRAHELASA